MEVTGLRWSGGSGARGAHVEEQPAGLGEGQAPVVGQAHVTGKPPRMNVFQTWTIILSSSSSFPHSQDKQLGKSSCGHLTQKGVFFPKTVL